jgi:hypothetical protein
MQQIKNGKKSTQTDRVPQETCIKQKRFYFCCLFSVFVDEISERLQLL